MLNAIRKQAGSWVVKALLLLLVASFAVWGIGDVFYGGGQDPVIARVGDSDIHASEVVDEFNRSLNTLQRQLGTTLDRQRAIQLGLMQQSVQDLIARRLIDLRAQEMGLAVSDETLRRLITQDPMFQTGGQFDRSRFNQLLMANGMSEESYLAMLRQDVVRDTLTGSLAAPVEVPDPLADALYRHRNEQRKGRMLLVEAASMTDLPEPTPEELEAYHAEHEDQFRAPEYRGLTFITLEPEDLLDEVEIGDEAIEQIYQDRMETYRTPERRTVQQLLANERPAIERAAELVREGKSFEDVARELADQGVTQTPLGEVAKEDLPEGLSEPVFALQKDVVSAPVESPFGWHLFRVTEIKPEQVTPLEEVRDEIRRELAREEAAERLPSLANSLDDELAAGQTIEEAANALGLEVESIEAVDRQGRSPKGERPAALPEAPEFLEVAFETPAKEASLLEETGEGGYFVLRVDKVEPSRVKPLEEVREQVVEGWRQEKRGELAEARAKELLGSLKEGVSLEGVAEKAGIELTPVEAVKRDARNPSPAVVRTMFATEAGDVADQVVPVGGDFALVATDEVVGANPAGDQPAVERLKNELAAEMRNDLLSEFQAVLRKDYPVEIDMAELDRLGGEDGLAAGGSGGLF
jgi:peptidyl-prolyl cis-trans isomerase D